MRLSQPIRAYTSVRVNWTRRELVFVNEPLPVADKVHTGAVIGIDRGVVHTAADDRGGFYDAPNTAELDKKRKFHQRRMAKSKLIAARQRRRFWESRRYQAHKAAAADLAARQLRIRDDFAHKLSTQLVYHNDVIGIETLPLERMTRRATGKGAARNEDSIGPCAMPRWETRQVHRVQSRSSGGRRRRGARRLHQSALPSMRTHSRENRESQAVFSCKACAWTGNADTNAAINVREEALTRWAAQTEKLAGTSGEKPGGVAVSQAGSKNKTDPHTGPAPGPAASAMNREPPNAA